MAAHPHAAPCCWISTAPLPTPYRCLQQTYDDFLQDIDATHKAPHLCRGEWRQSLHLITDLSRQYAPDRDAAETWRHYWQTVETAVLNAPPLPGTRKSWPGPSKWAGRLALRRRAVPISSLPGWRVMPCSLQIESVVGADLCERGKPDPAIYHLLIETPGHRRRRTAS